MDTSLALLQPFPCTTAPLLALRNAHKIGKDVLFLSLEQEAGPFPGNTWLSACYVLTVCQPGFPLNDNAQTAEIQRRILPADRVFLELLAQGSGAVAAPDWPESLLISGDVPPFAMPWWHGGSVAVLWGKGCALCLQLG